MLLIVFFLFCGSLVPLFLSYFFLCGLMNFFVVIGFDCFIFLDLLFFHCDCHETSISNSGGDF